ncbi:hypothetical protein [Pelagibacterium sp.]|uniref:hypothetical protein n=1 Tax=Pelagibacterium sp. TaxID=1967288 RepID=UPI003BA89B74
MSNPSPLLSPELLDAVDRRIASEKGIPLPSRPAQPQAAQPQVQQPQVAGSAQPQAPAIGTEGLSGFTNAIASGIVEAGFQTKDFFFGEPADEDKSWLRQQHEGLTEQLDQSGPVNAITQDIAQFGAGLVGAGKLMAPIKVLQDVKNAGAVGRGAYEVARGAVAGFFALDPHEERLSNLIEQYEPLRNPITEYLAADPDDTAVEGRFKNALEGIGMDLALAGILEGSLKAIRAFRRGDTEAGEAALREVEELQAQREVDDAAMADIEGRPQTPEESTQPGAGEAGPSAPEVELPASTAPESASRATPEAELAEGVEIPDGIPKITVRRDPELAGGAAPSARSGDEGATASSTAPDATTARPAPTETPDVATILDSARADLAAIRVYGSRGEASMNGHRFAERQPLPWNTLRGTNEVQAFVEQAAATVKQRLDAAKGGDVLSDLQVQEMVRQRADAFSEDPAEIMAELVKAGNNAKDLVANMEASFLLSQRFLQETYEMSTRYRMGNLKEWGGDAARAGAELKSRMAAASDLLGAAMSMRAASGRAMRRLRTQFQITPEDIEGLKDVAPEKLAELLYATQGDPKKLVQAANPSFLRRVLDEATFSLTNSLLWMWPTHAVNLTSNLYMLAARPTEKMLGSLVMGSAGSAVRKQAAKEYAYTVASIGDGWTAMVEAFKRGDSIISPYTDEYFGTNLRIPQKPLQWKPVRSIDDLVENGWKALNYRVLVGLPTRALGAVDEFMKSLRYRAVVQAKANVEAAERGLKGEELEAFIAQRLAKAFDTDGRALNADALKEAQTATFQQELLSGTAGKSIQTFRSSLPITTLILPFVKTPINVLRYAWKMTPGLNMAQKEYRQMLSGKMGPEQQAHAFGQMALGASFMGVAGVLAASGRLTGSGPKDPQLLSELRAAGWQPYSLTWEDGDGKRHYFPLGRFDPITLSMSMVADLVELQQAGAKEKDIVAATGAVGLALAKSFQDRTFLQNLNTALQAASDPENRLERFLGQTAGNAIPFSSLIRGTNPDPYLRDARGFLDSIMSKLPGFSETLPPRRDAFGEPVWKRIGLATTEDSDIVEAEHNRIMLETEHGIRPPSPHHSGVDLRKVTLSDGRNAYDVYQQLVAQPGNGPSLKESLARLIQSDGYQGLVDGEPGLRGTKIGALMDVVSRYRQAGKAELLRAYPELRQQLAQSQMDVRSELQAKQEQGSRPEGNLEELLRSMGY